MLAIFYCIRDEHDPRLILLAGLICVVSTVASVLLLRNARDSVNASRIRWTVAAGAATGFGIWATHFVAMLGYSPEIVMGYHVSLTMASLLIAIVATTLGFGVAIHAPHRRLHWQAGLIVGGGVAAMHYLGMLAVEMPGYFTWAPGHVILSILLGVMTTIPAISLSLHRDGLKSGLAGGLLLAASILLLHFTGMAAITIVPGGSEQPDPGLLSPLAMGGMISGMAFAAIAVCLTAALLSTSARQTIAAREREFRMFVQGITDCAIYMLDPEGRVVSWNIGAERLKGYSAAEAIGLPLSFFYTAEDCAADLPGRELRTALEQGRINVEGWRHRKDGSRFWAHITIETVRDEHGRLHGFGKMTRDMTRFKEDQDRLASMAANLNTALSNMQQGLCLFDADERLIMSNDRICEMFGLTREELSHNPLFEDLFRLAMERRAGTSVLPETVQDAVERHRVVIGKAGGGTIVVPFTGNATLSIAHRPMPQGGWVSTFEDISERREAESRIEHMALHDHLTGLPNRAHYTGQLASAFEQAERDGTCLAVIGIDLDRFKEVNDAYGHATGDQVLSLLADRMRTELQADELIARFGGDEFAALKPFTEPEQLDDFVARLEHCLTSQLEHDGLTIFPGASLGVALFPRDGKTPEQLLNNADLAMYRAKETIGRKVCHYEQGMDEAWRTRRLLAKDLREAIGRDELSLAYQVQCSVRTGAIVGYEALLRWQHPRDGWVSPSEFIPIAEESGEIVRIGEWVLRKACAEATTWEEPWRVAVNLSAIQLMQVDIVSIVIDALLESGLPASRLELEITETAFVSDKLRALHILRQIKALGVQIAIDDFGTGYSSLDTLNSFPFDKIKIDKSFLLESASNHQARAIIRAVLALGRSLGIPVLAEGLESAEQLRLLRNEGCDEAQGYYFGHPMPTASSPAAWM